MVNKQKHRQDINFDFNLNGNKINHLHEIKTIEIKPLKSEAAFLTNEE